MTWRKTLGYWMVALLLGGYYLIASRQPPVEPEPEVARERLVPAVSGEVRGVVLLREGRTVRAAPDGERWRVVSPQGVTIPHDLVTALVETITDRQHSEVILESPTEEDLEAFGLKSPETVLELELANGGTTVVDVGRRNPTRTAVYARTSESPRIMLAGLNVQYYSDLLFQAAYPARSATPQTAASVEN